MRLAAVFQPGDNAEMLTSAASRDADALIFDLEDTVVPANSASGAGLGGPIGAVRVESARRVLALTREGT